MYKYYLPRLKEDIYIRKKLVKLFNKNSDKKLIYIEGEAGVGKTTLLSIIFNKKENFSYLISDEYDKNKNILLKSITISLIKNGKLKFKIPQSKLLNFIINFLNSKKDDFYLIIDNFQEICDEVEIIELIKFIIKNTNENIHIVISSRYKLPENFYIDLLREKLFIISSDLLKLDKNEIKDFFRFKRIKIDESVIGNIYKKSGGWILYINLFSKFYSNKIKFLNPKIIDKFFDEEVFSKLKDSELKVLKLFTICEIINKNLLKEIDEEGYKILESLTNRNIFVEEDENFFKIHPVFKEEITNRYGLYDKEESLKIAKILNKVGFYRDAFNIYKIFNETYEMVETLEKWGMRLIEKEEVFILENFINLIPEKNYSQKIYMFLSEIEKNKGNYKKALERIKKVNDINFNKKEKAYLNLLKGEIQYLNGNYKGAYKLLSSISLSGLLEIRRLHTLGIVNNFLNNEIDFKKCLEKALILSEKYNDLYREIRIQNDLVVGWYEPKGEIITSEIMLKKALFLIKKNNLAINPIILGNLTYLKDLLGEFEEGEKIGLNALKIARKSNDKSKIIFILRVLSSIYIKLNELDKAKNLLEEALILTEDCPDPSRKIGILYNLSFLYERLNQFDKALFFANEDLELTKKMNNKKFISQSYLNLGRIFYRFKNYEKSKNYLLKASEFFEKGGYLLNLFETYLFLLLNPNNDENEMEKLKNKIIYLIDKKGYIFYLKSILTKEEEKHVEEILKLKKEKRFTIKTFGKFSFYRDGIEVKDSEWIRESVKDLLKYLIIKKGRALKDEIYDEVFPNLSLSSKYTSLRVSISILKRILEPSLKRYETSKYIKIDKDLVYLNFDEFYIDSFEFENISKNAKNEKNLTLISKAIEIYKDRFLNEDRYKDFVIHKTLEYEEAYINLLNLYGELSIDSKNREKGLQYLRKSLEIDPFQDEILKKYFYFLIKSNKRALATKLYKEFKEKYKRNWDIDISKIINMDKIL